MSLRSLILRRVTPLRQRLRRYPGWVSENHFRIVWACALLAAAGLALTATLPLHTEFSRLLPDDQPSVKALRQLTARKPSSAVVEVGIASPSPQVTERFAADLAVALRRAIPPDLLGEIDADDDELRRFVWDHRHLYASVADLEKARDFLEERVQRELSKKNPLLVDLSDEPAPQASDKKDPRVETLEARLKELRALRDRPRGYVGEEGRLRMLVLRCPFGDTEPEKGARLLELLDRTVQELQPARYHPELSVGYAGDPVTASLEHNLVLRDVVFSTVLCLSLVMLLLFITLRAPWAVLALCLSLFCGCAWTFGLTRLCIGHLNSSTAFLGSVVAGNGINFGIILLSRYLEERRRGDGHEAALSTALAQTMVPTLAASLAAGAAYLSLIVTSFRGFSEFGIIAGSGMVLSWISSILLLPALLALFDKSGRLALRPRPGGGALTALIRPLQVGATVLMLLTSAVAIYGGAKLSRNPFEDDLRTLRSRSLPRSEPGRWSRRLDAAFGRDQSGGFYIGASRAEDVPLVIEAVRRVEEDVPKEQRLFGKIDALPLVLPGTAEEQRRKIELLDDMRPLLQKIERHLEAGAEERRLLDELRPPEALRPVAFADLPQRIQRMFTEQDGRAGLLMAIHPGTAYQSWSYRDIHRVVQLLRSLPVPPEVRDRLLISGPEVIFNDMMEAVRRDGPRATMLAVGLVLLLLVVSFGVGSDLAITVFAVFLGMFGMIGLMTLCGIRLNFLNYIAIPITIGIGVDYPFNVMARLRQELRSGGGLQQGLLHTGTAVILCSMTTMIGYAALLFSDTGAIRSFGQAAVIGEITTIVAAVAIVPWLLSIFGKGRQA